MTGGITLPVKRRTYELYGRHCASELVLPELAPGATSAPEFSLTASREIPEHSSGWAERVMTDDGEEWLSVATGEDEMVFRFMREVRFVSRETTPHHHAVTVEDSGLSPATVRHFFLDEVVPALLASSGSLVLHGAAIDVGGMALLVTGESGAGKSTLAAAFAAGDHPLLADDCIVLDQENGKIWAQPSYPSLRAWPDTAEFFFGASARSLPFTHDSAKRRYRDGIEFSCVARPVVAIACLVGETATDSVAFHDVQGHAAGASVVGAAKNMPLGPKKAEAFEALLQLADRVPVIRISGPRGFEQVNVLRDRLVGWVQAE
jgi:hypothetical protein